MKLFLATGNAHKVEEFQRLFATADLPVAVHPAPGGMPSVDETAENFEGNALLKAEALREKLGPDSWVLADDSGLEVAALGGAPGVRSARYAGESATDADNRRKLLEALAGVPELERAARFVCVLALLGPDVSRIFEGVCMGRIVAEEAGTEGFGYDPLFVPEGFGETFAEMPSEQKNQLSHRGCAMEELVLWLRGKIA